MKDFTGRKLFAGDKVVIVAKDAATGNAQKIKGTVTFAGGEMPRIVINGSLDERLVGKEEYVHPGDVIKVEGVDW